MSYNQLNKEATNKQTLLEIEQKIKEDLLLYRTSDTEKD